MAYTVVHPILGTFTLQTPIGHGTFATVFLAKHEETGLYVAIKTLTNLMIDISQIYDESSDTPLNYHSNIFPSRPVMTEDQQEVELIKREVQLMRGVWHPLVVNLYDCFQYNKKLMFLSEYIEGDNLLNYVNQRGALDEVTARRMFSQMVLILDYIHNQKKIVHRDLKCENFMVDKNENVHLIDFGFAKSFASEDDKSFNVLLNTTCGSPGYIAPEIITSKPYDASVDIWSLGVILFAMTHGQLPFDDPNTNKLLTKVVELEPEYDTELSPELLDLLKSMLKKNASERATLEQIKSHPWITVDENGRQWTLTDRVFSTFMPFSKNGTQQILFDDRALMALHFGQGEKDQIMDDMLNSKLSRESLLYMIMKKTLIQNQIKNTAKMIFASPTNLPPKRVHTFSAYINPFLAHKSLANHSENHCPEKRMEHFDNLPILPPTVPQKIFLHNRLSPSYFKSKSPPHLHDQSTVQSDNHLLKDNLLHPPAQMASSEPELTSLNRTHLSTQQLLNPDLLVTKRKSPPVNKSFRNLANGKRSSLNTAVMTSKMLLSPGDNLNQKPRIILYRKAIANSNC